MSNSFGTALRLTIFGQSHGPAVGLVADGLPAGMAIDMDGLRIDRVIVSRIEQQDEN